MFTYIDPTVRERLVDTGKLIRINTNGHGNLIHGAFQISLTGKSNSIFARA